MTKLVIVESPNKIKKITKLLGTGFKVMASMGHIRDLPKKSMGIDIENNYRAKYEITKNKVVQELRKACKTASTVYIATDPDREGDGIGWHLVKVLNLSYPKARRMTFNEITKTAVQNALAEANRNGKMDMNSVNSYQARRFIDRITGFKASPLLWKNITGAKSAGRVQSVATKLITDRETDIEKHIPEEKYLISGIFETENKEQINAQLKQVPKKHDEAFKVLNFCKEAEFKISDTQRKTVYHSPPPAFKTSVFQQEVGKRYGISPKDAMRIAQMLYEKGKITYHRTDTTRLSDQFKGDVKNYVETKFGSEYLNDELKTFNPENKTEEKKKKGEQGGHEAIRPTDINTFFLNTDNFQQKEKLIYRMIWVRAVASLMAKEKCHRYTVKIILSNTDKYWFTASYLLTIFLGFKILNEKKEKDNKNKVLMTIKDGNTLKYVTIESKQTFSQPLNRYTESSLVKELEKKGIGRPSTYANIITTVQTRKYVIKKKSVVIKKDCLVDILKNNKIISKKVKVDFGDKKQRLFPTSLGIDVTSFLVKHLGYMMEYKFTSELENDLDKISNGGKNWIETVDNLTKTLQTLISDVPVKKKEKTNRLVGKHNGSKIEFFVGQYGPFIKYKGKCYSLPKECKELSDVSVDIAIKSMNKKKENYLVSHDCKIDNESGKIQGLRGKFGLYLRFLPDNGKKPTNYFLPKNLKEDDEAVKNLTLEDCLKQVEFVSKYKKKK